MCAHPEQAQLPRLNLNFTKYLIGGQVFFNFYWYIKEDMTPPGPGTSIDR